MSPSAFRIFVQTVASTESCGTGTSSPLQMLPRMPGAAYAAMLPSLNSSSLAYSLWSSGTVIVS